MDKRFSFVRSFCAGAVMLAVALPAFPQTKPPVPAGASKVTAQTAASQNAADPFAKRKSIPGNDWIQLFNEKDLTGWSPVGAESWTVEGDGILHGKGLTKAYGYLQTDKPYKDFQLSLRFKCVGDGNSGVFFHTSFDGVDAKTGFQFEIDCSMMHHTAGVYAEDGRGWVVWPAPENEGVVRKGEWNDYLVEVVGNRYKSRLNGVPMVDFTDPKPGVPDGTLALQLHAGGDGNMQFKDIWIRDLSKR